MKTYVTSSVTNTSLGDKEFSKKREIVFQDGSKGIEGDFPVAVVYAQPEDGRIGGLVVDPIFNYRITDNLYGRIMTLVEATTETGKLKAVKDLFSKELNSWANDVYGSAREIANNGGSSDNVYNPSNLYNK